jgi:hypothetical protein
MYDYDPKLITEQLNLLTAEEVRYILTRPPQEQLPLQLPHQRVHSLQSATDTRRRVFVVSKTFAEIAKEVERWYQTAYRVDPMSPNQLSVRTEIFSLCMYPFCSELIRIDDSRTGMEVAGDQRGSLPAASEHLHPHKIRYQTIAKQSVSLFSLSLSLSFCLSASLQL